MTQKELERRRLAVVKAKMDFQKAFDRNADISVLKKIAKVLRLAKSKFEYARREIAKQQKITENFL